MKHITSPENALYKSLLKLARSSRERRKTRQALLDGTHLVGAYCASIGAPQTLILSATGLEHEETQSLLRQMPELKPVVLADSLFKQISPVTTPTGILAIIEVLERVVKPQDTRFCVLLEELQDAGNLGSILRSAAAAGADAAFLSKNCAFAWSPKTLRAAMGAHFQLRLAENADLVEVAKKFRGKLVAAKPHAKKSLYEVDLRGPVAFIIGNEGAGLSEPLLNLAHHRVNIFMPGKIESLNAAAAAAVCLFEKVRQEQVNRVLKNSPGAAFDTKNAQMQGARRRS
ncbi:MAG TPA: RNA methyltransferase [Burkholderiales bacterium]|nr:RNA methyltransferase [Burkholderiales bacterium]